MKILKVRETIKDTLLKDGDYTSIKEMLERIIKFIPNANLLADLDENKNIVYHTTTDIYNDVNNLADGLIAMGLENKHIAISADNSYLYVIADMAISSGVGVVTPIDRDAPEELLQTLLNKCDADAIICSAYVLTKIQKILPQCEKLKTIILMDKPVEGYPFIKDVMKEGQKEENKGKFLAKELDLDKPAKLLFTSGTTGPNKSVILTQNNLAANMMNCLDTVTVTVGVMNTSMSVLPMHHATEINTHIMARIGGGQLTYINDSMKNMMTNIKIFKPSIITIVPMIANAFYSNIWLNAKKAGKDKLLRKGIKLCNLLDKFGINKRDKLFKDVYEPFGGNLRQIVCGGAVLNPEVVKGLKDLGIYIVNGYGITECGPLISMNTNTFKEVYSVGKACSGLEAKIINVNEEGVGELCVRGKCVSKGYYKDEEATKKAFMEDGFFNTGDLAKIDKNGNIFLTGRKKNAIVLANGKNISPEEIETELQNIMPYCKDIVVYMAPGKNGVQVLCAGLFIEEEAVRNNHAKISEDVKAVNKIFPNYKQIQFVNLTTEEYPKTSTRKIKRDTLLNLHNFETGIKI